MNHKPRVERILELLRTTAPAWGIDEQALARVESRLKVSHTRRTELTPACPHPRALPWPGAFARAAGRRAWNPA